MKKLLSNKFKFLIVTITIVAASIGFPKYYGDVLAMIGRSTGGGAASRSGHLIRQSNPSVNGLVGYWPLDNNVRDFSGNNYHGTPMGAYARSFGKIGGSYWFGAGEAGVLIGTQAVFNIAADTTLTLSGWFYRELSISNDVILAKKYEIGSTSAGYIVYIDATDDKLHLEVSDGTNYYNISSSQTFVNPGWVHFAVTWNQVTATSEAMYINGASVSTSVSRSAGDVTVVANGYNFKMGGPTNSTPSVCFSGYIDEVRFHSRVLSPADALDLYKGSNPPNFDQSIAGYWNLDETSGSLVREVSMRSTNVLSDSSNVASASGVLGNAADFSSDSLSLADNPSISAGDNTFTIAAWVSLDTKGSNRTFVSKYVYGNWNASEYVLWYNQSADRFEFEVCPGTDSLAQIDADTLGSPSTGTWYFIVAWHDAGSDTINIQVNNGTVDSVSYDLGIADTETAFNIGSIGAGNYQDGLIDEVAFWRRALSSDDRTSLYNSGSGKAYSQLTSDEKGSLVSYWSMDESADGSAPVSRSDSHGYNGIISNATPGEGVYSGGYSFNPNDGSNDYITIRGPITTATDNFTIETWINPTALPQLGQIVQNGDGTGGWGIGISDGSASDNSGSKLVALYSGVGWIDSGYTFTSANTWYHVVLVCNSSGKTIFYVNGVAALLGGDNGPNTPSNAFSIGRRSDPGANSYRYFNGAIDEVRIYNRALADYEIFAHYIAGK